MSEASVESETRSAPVWRAMALRAAVFLSLIALLGGLGGGLFARSQFVAAGPSAEQTEDAIVMLNRGDSVSAIGRKLKDAELIRSVPLFALGARITGAQSNLKAGEYAIPPGASMADILDIFVEGKSILHPVTIPEGRTTAQALSIIAEDPVLVGDITLEPAEGALLPETYLFTRGETRDGLIG
ncbi:MAG: endolytic transglycosylase MltG, partial [Pseudomonadota bacterium]